MLLSHESKLKKYKCSKPQKDTFIEVMAFYAIISLYFHLGVWAASVVYLRALCLHEYRQMQNSYTLTFGIFLPLNCSRKDWLSFQHSIQLQTKYQQASLTHVCDSYSLTLFASLFEKLYIYNFLFFPLKNIWRKQSLKDVIIWHWCLMRLIVWGPSCLVLILRKIIISQSAVLNCCSVFYFHSICSKKELNFETMKMCYMSLNKHK